MVKVCSLFLDYAGTISPLNVSREASRVPPRLEELLFKIARIIPIAVFSTKDLKFILPRTPFASAWSVLGGLELKIGTELFISRGIGDVLPFVTQSLKYAKQHIRDDIFIEEKCDYRGQPLAFCIDWRETRDKVEVQDIVAQISAYCKNFPLTVIEYQDKPYFDVFPCMVDKGQALKELKEKLGLSGGIIYMGDSIIDNSAFKEADISIGIDEEEEPIGLQCDYWIKFKDVPIFLDSLYNDDLIFSPNLRGLKVMEKTFQHQV